MKEDKTYDGGYCKKYKRLVRYDKLKCRDFGKLEVCQGPSCKHWDCKPPKRRRI